MRDLTDHEGSQLVPLLQFVHLDEEVPVLADHRVDLITSEGGQLEYNLKVDLYVLVVDDPGLDDVVVCGVHGAVPLELTLNLVLLMNAKLDQHNALLHQIHNQS